jgi:hypothetical protein
VMAVPQVCAPNGEALEAAKRFISEFAKDEMSLKGQVEKYTGPPPEVGSVFRDCEVKGVHPFGAFVEVRPLSRRVG